MFVGLGAWWGLPVLSVVMLVGLLVAAPPLRREVEEAVPPARDEAAAPRPPIPSRFAWYAGFAML